LDQKSLMYTLLLIQEKITQTLRLRKQGQK